MPWLLRPWLTAGAGAGGSKRGIGRAELFAPVPRPYFLSPPAEDCLCDYGVLRAISSSRGSREKVKRKNWRGGYTWGPSCRIGRRRGPQVFLEHSRKAGFRMQPLYLARDRGSRAGRSRQGRLWRLRSRRAAHAGVSAAAWAQPSGQGARSQGAGQVPRVRSEGTSITWGARAGEPCPRADRHNWWKARRTMATQRQPKKWLPRSQPMARAIAARSGSRTPLCPANYRRSCPGSRKSCPLSPASRRTAARLRGNVSVVDWRENFAVVCARVDVAAG
jgi:hypothetical protein